MKTFSVTNELNQWMCEIRRHIHSYPELAFKEFKTSAYICKKLTEIAIPFKDCIAQTGIVADIGPYREDTPCVALRADMDALPLQEKTGLPFSSQHSGIMHACGHDGHVALLLGAAALLKDINLPGRVRLIFQPAEESGGGAKQMVQEDVLKGVSAIIGGHLDRHLKVGEIAVQSGLICAYTDEFRIEVNGKGGHGGKPHETIDSILIACFLVTAMQSLISREINPTSPSVLSVGKIYGGEAANIIAESTVIEGTIRTTDKDVREQLLQGVTRMVSSAQSLYKAQAQLTFTEGYPPVVNDSSISKTASIAARKVVGAHGLLGLDQPSMGGEDFSFYLKEIPGCFVRLGAMKYGVDSAAHSPQFDFDEGSLAIGASFMAQAAYDYLATISR